jgi:hypothetical protein
MRTTALFCVLLIVASSAAAVAEVTTGSAWPSTTPGHELTTRTGNCSLTPAERADLDPRFANRCGPNAPTGVWRDPPCDLLCSACWYPEGEGACYDEYVDDYNGGCNSSPEVFTPVYPGYGPVTICGQGGNYMFGGAGYRDTDWYELTFTQEREITVTCTAEFPVTIYLIDAAPGCGSPVAVAEDSQPECVEASFTYTVAPGTWWVWVGASEFYVWPCDSDYLLTIDGYDFACALDCPEGATNEGEPICEADYEDHYNGGCNSAPEVFQRLDPSATTSHYCGEAGFYDYLGSCYRDTDWYELVLDEPREVTACVTGEFPVQVMFLHPLPDCLSTVYGVYDYADVCEEVCITEALDAGVHWLWIGSQFVQTVPCGSRYIFSVSGYTTPVEERSWGLIKSLYR